MSKNIRMLLVMLAGVLAGMVPYAGVTKAWAEKPGIKVHQPTQPVARRFRRNLPRNHDRGFLMRLSLGLGYASISSNSGSDAFEVSGLGVLPSVTVGWLPYEQVGLHLSGWGILGGDATAAGFGPGVTYYFSARENTWVSAAIGPTIFDDLESDGIQWALGGEVEAGLYGWIGPRWSMGASLVGGLSGFDLDRDSVRPWGWSTGIRLGIVFN